MKEILIYRLISLFYYRSFCIKDSLKNSKEYMKLVKENISDKNKNIINKGTDLLC